jgi:uncharacterized protein
VPLLHNDATISYDHLESALTTEKLEHLKKTLTEMESVVVAYSGGTDSTLLLKVAHDCLAERAVAVTAVSPSLPSADRAQAETIAREIGANLVFVEGQELEEPRYLENTSERCYHCKATLFDQLLAYAREKDYRFVVEGANVDDAGDFRPGLRAARERGVRSPLQEVGLTKPEIRQMARLLGLPNWDRPAEACLASRVPYGTPITPQRLAQVERAEAVLHQLGLAPVRVRHHGSVARIEVEPGDFKTVLSHRDTIVGQLKAAGYTYVTLDLAGFRSGSMNEVADVHGPQ